MAKTNSGLLEFKDAQKVLIALDDATSEVKKAVVIDADGVETDIQGVQPTGKKEITSTAEVNVANYATAQVVDEDLVAGNIKKDVDILGVVGSYEAPASDFSTAQVTVVQEEASLSGLVLPAISDDTFEIQIYRNGIHTVPLYKGSLFIMDSANIGIIQSVSGDIVELGEGHDFYYRIYGNCTITIS